MLGDDVRIQRGGGALGVRRFADAAKGEECHGGQSHDGDGEREGVPEMTHDCREVSISVRRRGSSDGYERKSTSIDFRSREGHAPRTRSTKGAASSSRAPWRYTASRPSKHATRSPLAMRAV